MINIKDIAMQANVSTATVSRVINGTAKVDIDKKNKILEIIKNTGYVPNQIARSLSKRSSMIIGLIVPNIENPFFNELAKCIEEKCFLHNYKLILCNSNEDIKKEELYLQMLKTMNTDGVILITTNNEIKDSTYGGTIPIVVLDREVKERNENVLAYIQSNHFEGAKLATKHLIECGCKNIVHMKGPEKHSSAIQRFEGYKAICKANNIQPMFIDCDYNYESGIKNSKLLFEKFKNVDGISASSDIVAIALLKVMREMNISAPKDVQIVGFDNIKLSKMISPEITTVSQPIAKIGEMAVQIIIDLVEKNITSMFRNVVEVSLKQRETTIKIN